MKRYHTCEEIYRPLRFGVMGGWDLTSYSMLKDAWGVSTKPTGSIFSFGAFVDVPILQTGVSFHPEVIYSKQAYRLTETPTTVLDKECIANIESYSVPLLIRYTWWKNKWSPYLNLGVAWQHYSRLENSILEADVSDGMLNTRQTEPALSPSKYSTIAGGGVWYKLTKRNSLFIEGRTSFNSDKLTYHIFAGINF